MTTGLEGKYVVARGNYAGVHVGVLQSFEGKTAVLTEARRLWQWNAARNSAHLSGVANHGLAPDSNVGEPIDRMVMAEDVCELLLCSAEAEANLRAYPSKEGRFA